jgi:hypothetical protein
MPILGDISLEPGLHVVCITRITSKSGATCTISRESNFGGLLSVYLLREDSVALQCICYLDGAARSALHCVLHKCRALH